jgi:hypothetical protein
MLAIKKELKDILKHDNRWINIVMGRILKGLEPQAGTQVIKRFVPPFCSFQTSKRPITYDTSESKVRGLFI